MEKFNAKVPLDEFYSAIVTMLISLDARQVAINKHIAEIEAILKNDTWQNIFNQIENDISATREKLSETYFSEYGEMFPEILSLLKKKKD